MWPKNSKSYLLIVIVLAVGTVAFLQNRRVNALNDRLNCTAFWLHKAKALHQNQMGAAGDFSGEAMRELMTSVDGAYDCATKEASLGHPPGAGAFGQYGILPHK
jgi:hypothetical protein